MFKMFKEAARRSRYETNAWERLKLSHNFDVNMIGEMRLAELTDEILDEMDSAGKSGDAIYQELLIARLTKMGYL